MSGKSEPLFLSLYVQMCTIFLQKHMKEDFNNLDDSGRHGMVSILAVHRISTYIQDNPMAKISPFSYLLLAVG